MEGTLPRGLVRRRLIDAVVALLRQGITPRQLALSLAIGVVIGVFPIVGTTTVLCLTIAFGFRLNVVAMQLANHLVYPAQLLLIVPFVRLGERLLGATRLPLNLHEIQTVFASGLWHGVSTFSTSLGHAVAGWAITAPAAAGLIYLAARPILERSAAAYAARRGETDAA